MAKKSILSDFEEKFFKDFDAFVKKTYQELASDANYGGVSPAYTGYFASSWQVASNGYIKREDPAVSQKRRSKDFPWDEVYEDNWRARNAGTPYSRARIAPEEVHEPSVMRRTFCFRSVIRIGNTAAYAPYALKAAEKGSVAKFVQGDIRKLVDAFFGDRKDMADLRIRTAPTPSPAARLRGEKAYTPVMRGRDQ